MTGSGETPSTDEPVAGEWLFRLCAAVATWALLSLLASTIVGVLILPILLSDSPGPELFAIPFVVLAPLGVWFFGMVRPLKKRGQTIGMRWFGLTLVRADGTPRRWSQIIFREGLQALSLLLVVGVIGVIWALWDEQGRTLFDRIFATRVVRSTARLHTVEEFRAFTTEKAAAFAKRDEA